MKTGTRAGRPRPADYRNLFQAVATLKSAAEAGDFLRDLCTPAELEAMADRWRAVQMLKQGRTYREISEATGMSVTTVGRVARFMSDGFGGYDRVFQRTSRRNR